MAVSKLLRILKMSGVLFVSGVAMVAAIILLGSLLHILYQQFGAMAMILALIFGICIIVATIAEEMY